MTNDSRVGIGGDWGAYGSDANPLYNLHFVGSNNATNGHAAFFDNRVNATNNGAGFLFRNLYGNHSWGVVAEYRIDGAGDRPSILFSSNQVNTSWSVGFVTGSDDTFRITKNHGHRAYYGGWTGTGDGWGTPYLTINTSGNVTAPVDMRSPIFYNHSNTGYYVDGDSTSVLYYLSLQGGNATAQGQATSVALKIAGYQNYESLELGIEDSYQGVIRSYGNDIRYYAGHWKTTGNTATEDHSHYWYTSKNGSTNWSSAKMRLNHDATLSVTGDMRAPIFYDSDNTGYYIDPNNNANIAGNVYIGGWFRNYGYTGLYNESYGNHWYATGNDYWNLAGNNGTNVGIIFRTGGHQGTSRGYVYADSSNNIGFLNSGGSWRLRVVGDDYSLADGSSMRAQIFYDSNDTTYYADFASSSTSVNTRGAIVSGGSGSTGGGLITINGNLGSLSLHPAAGATAAEIRSSASLLIKTNTTSVVASISTSGIVSSGSITAFGSPSDRNLKENIIPLTNSLEKVRALQGVSFNWKKDTQEHTITGLDSDIGLIAQNVQEIFPELVRDQDGTLTLRERGLIAVLVEAVKEQDVKIKQLEALVETLVSKLGR
jgi:hypothetical protein